MKYGILLCVLCLLVVGTASAATLNTAIIQQQTNRPVAVAAVSHTAAITFDSSVKGATVYLDGALVGSDEAHSKTPVTDNIVTAGSHTATFRLSGYKESVSSFSVEAGKPQTIYAQLQPAIARAVVVSEVVQPAGGLEKVSPVPSSVPVAQGNVVDSFIQTVFSVFQPASGSATRSGLQVQPSGLDVGVNRSGLHADNSINPIIIGPESRLFIGEQGLDVTQALNRAYTYPDESYTESKPAVTTIGWWASEADVYKTAPTKQVDLSGNYQNLYVDPAIFVGYTGKWWIVNPKGYPAKSSADVNYGVVFIVEDPSINISKTWSMTRGPVSGKSITRGDKIGFIIDSDMPHMVATSRSPLPSSPFRGFIDIVIQDPSGKLLTSINTFETTRLYDHIRVFNNITSLQNQCAEDVKFKIHQGKGSDVTEVFPSCCLPLWWWDTGALDSNGQLIYPKGTYTVWAVSRLNNMDNNYKNGGQPYTGKTVSGKITFTLE